MAIINKIINRPKGKKVKRNMKNNVENCKDLSGKIRNWKNFDEAELKIIVKNFEKVPREEITTFYFPFLTNEIAEKLLQIGEKYNNNTKMICDIIPLLGNLIKRYNINATDKIYSFFKKFVNQPKIDYYVAIHIDNFPQFNESKDKWEYIFSILNIRPKQKSFQVFYAKISRILHRKEIIPQEYFDKLTEMFNEFLADETKSVWAKKEYSHTLELLNQRTNN